MGTEPGAFIYMCVCIYKNKDEDRQTDPKDVGKGGSTIQTAGRTRAEREGNLSPSPPNSISLGLPKLAPWGLWGRVAARLGRDGGQEAQHHKMAPPEVGARTKQPGAPSPFKKSLTLGVKGPGVRSLPEPSMVVSSTAAVGCARDPGHLLIHLLLGPFRWGLTGSKAWSVTVVPA